MKIALFARGKAKRKIGELRLEIQRTNIMIRKLESEATAINQALLDAHAFVWGCQNEIDILKRKYRIK